jgi:acyl-CoA synthetase
MIDGLKINGEQKRAYYEKGYWTEKTMLDVWNEQAQANADWEYVGDDQGSRYTYGEIDEKANHLAAWLAEQGLGDGDIVAIQLPTWAEFCILYVACLKRGCVVLPLSTRFNDDDLIYSLDLVKARALICPTDGRIAFEDQAQRVRDAVSSLDTLLFVDKDAPVHSDVTTLSEALKTEAKPLPRPAATSDDVACLLLTSGTTGRSKAAMLTHNNVLFSERSFAGGYHRTKDDVMFMASPLNHAVGFFHGLVAPMLLGGRSFLMQDFNPERAIELICQEGATWSMSATPLIYDMLKIHHKNPETSFGKLDVYACGGAPVPCSLVECADRAGFKLCEVYGSTESCPHVFVPPEKCLEWHGAWSGIPYEGIEVRVVDENGNDVAPGVQGEEISRGPHQFVGYINEPERTNRALDDDGWFHSGDLCYADETGRIRINGRKKEVIIRGGENICAREIDDNLVGCPGVSSHATIGMPDERLGERICTFVVAEPGTSPTLDEVRDYLKQNHIAKRLWPERIEIIDAIPMTPLGKVQRFKLAEELRRRMQADGTWSDKIMEC